MSRTWLAVIIVCCTVAIVLTIVIVIPPLVTSPVLLDETTRSDDDNEAAHSHVDDEVERFDVDSEALAVLDAFLTCAVDGDIDGMWTYVCPDSRLQYRDDYDFKWFNGVYSKDWGYSLLVSYEVESADYPSDRSMHSSVVEAKVILKYAKSSAISAMEAIAGVRVPLDTEDKTWVTQLIKTDDGWNVVCPSNNPLKFFWYSP